MRVARKTTWAVAALVVVMGLSLALGYALRGAQSVTSSGSTSSSGGGAATRDALAYGSAPDAATGVVATPADAAAQSDAYAGKSTESTKVIRTASLEVRVDAIDPAVEKLRALVASAGGEITDLVVSRGADGGVTPLAKEDAAQSTSIASSPATARATVRVPVAALANVQKRVGELGEVLSMTSSQTDVTTQHIDMTARLKNLRAEEDRLRSFLTKATKVPEMLQVESELNRVRAEIESMQAQLDYLDRQIAMATFSVTLTEPGSVVRPKGNDWGFSAAVTDGFQAAASIIATLITGLIALVPLLVIIAVLIGLWIVTRRVMHARRRSGGSGQAEPPA